jgi:3-phosphoshikimate 1-carboxyvinyltransferase
VPSSTLHVEGEIRVPGDKSISHRALMLGALATGTSRIRGILQADDVQSTARVLRSLGAAVPPLAAELRLTGSGLRGFRAPPESLDCGNSGTTARLMAGILAGLPLDVTFVGDASLSRRPMARVADPLKAMGTIVEFPNGGATLPMRVAGGQLHEQRFQLQTPSAQVKSAILLAAVTGGVAVSVCEPVRTRDHTERMLAAAGVPIEIRGNCIHVGRAAHLNAMEIDVPGDPSSAAFFVALAALADAGKLQLRGLLLNPTRIGFLDVLLRMGARWHVSASATSAGEPVGDIVARASDTLRGVLVEGDEVPSMIDELPLLACVAARSAGETIIRGASELRVK